MFSVERVRAAYRQHLAQLLDFAVTTWGIAPAVTVRYHSGKATHCWRRPDPRGDTTYRLTFGLMLLEREFVSGFLEYRSLRWIVPFPPPAGYEACYWIMQHEFAHVVNQMRFGENVTPHGREFVACYRQLLAGLPWSALRPCYEPSVREPPPLLAQPMLFEL